ncbi:MAG TPA: ATPase P [Desulfovibrio sp.]|nr:ATPase P [Desulfovibrio sp.]
MIRLDIPGFKYLEIKHLILDYNGTLALDGELLPGVAEVLRELAASVTLHVLTADTQGNCRERLAGLPVIVSVVASGEPEDQAKLAYAMDLGPRVCACVGNGMNDRLVFERCGLSVAVLGPEGLSVQALDEADLVVGDVLAALNLFLHPLRLKASLRR